MRVFHKSNGRAFSLIEMMVVLGVVGLLLAFAAPNLFSLITSNSLTGEGVVLRNQLTFAQQTAVSKNADVEVRFFKMPDYANARDEEAFRGYQLFQYNLDGELVPISTFFRIKAPVGVHDELSTILDPRANTSAADKKFGFSSPTNGTTGAKEGGLLKTPNTWLSAFARMARRTCLFGPVRMTLGILPWFKGRGL